jgi:hypothetical protein
VPGGPSPWGRGSDPAPPLQRAYSVSIDVMSWSDTTKDIAASQINLKLLAAIFVGLRRALRLGLRIADGLGQHLAKLGLSLWRFAREAFCPCGHR